MSNALDWAFDFDLNGLAPADDVSEELVEMFRPSDLTVLAHHRTEPNGSHSFVVAHDDSATWGVPGAPQVVAIAVARDLSRSTFTMDSTYHAAAPFAQNWLIERGCPPERIALASGNFVAPADDLTVQVEQKIRMSGARYEVLDTCTSDFDPSETWTLALDSGATQVPVRIFREEWDYNAGTYTVREGAFADVSAARSWLDDRPGPLPAPPEDRHDNGSALRTRVALARSASPSATPKAAVPGTPPAKPVQRPIQGRLL
ncbi:glycosyl hydrolase [Streptomyces albidoflavus]